MCPIQYISPIQNKQNQIRIFCPIRSAVTAASAAMTEASLALLAGDTGYLGIRLGSP